MAHQLPLSLKHPLERYLPISEAAAITGRPVEQVLAAAIHGTIPSYMLWKGQPVLLTSCMPRVGRLVRLADVAALDRPSERGGKNDQ